MKTITVSVDDEIYLAATEAAAQRQKSLIALVQEFIERMSRLAESSGEVKTEDARNAQEEFAKFLDDLNARPLKDEPSMWETEVESKRAEFLERLQYLSERARERDHLKEGSVSPFSREELYAERLDRIR